MFKEDVHDEHQRAADSCCPPSHRGRRDRGRGTRAAQRSRRAGTGSRGLRRRLLPSGRRPALRRRQLGDLGPSPAAAGPGHRPGRRGDRPLLLLRRLRQRGPPRRRRRGVRRHRAGQLRPRPGGGRSRDHAAHRRDHAGASLRPPRGDGQAHAHRRQAQARRRRGRLPGPRRGAERHPRRRVRRGRHLQLLPDQEHALPRGRHGHHGRRRTGPHPAPPAQPGHGTAVRQRDRRRQHADDRRVRRRRPRTARQGGGVDRAAPCQRRVPRRPHHRPGRHHAAGGRGRPARLPPVHRADQRRPGRRDGEAHRGGHRQRGLLPDADPPAQALLGAGPEGRPYLGPARDRAGRRRGRLAARPPVAHRGRPAADRRRGELLGENL